MPSLRALFSPFRLFSSRSYDRLPGPVSLASTPPYTPPNPAPRGGSAGKRSASGRQRAGPGLIVFAVVCLALILVASKGVEGVEMIRALKLAGVVSRWSPSVGCVRCRGSACRPMSVCGG